MDNYVNMIIQVVKVYAKQVLLKIMVDVMLQVEMLMYVIHKQAVHVDGIQLIMHVI